MQLRRLVPLIALFSFQVLAEVEFDEKIKRVEFLEKLGSLHGSLEVGPYRRELEYERDRLPLEVRAQREAQLLANRLRAQVRKKYAELIEASASLDARAQLQSQIEADLVHVAGELRPEVRAIALDALVEVSEGRSGFGSDFSRLQRRMLLQVRQRARFLNQRLQTQAPDASHFFETPELHQLTQAQLRNTTKQQVLEGLVSERELAPYLMGSFVTVRSDVASRGDSRVSIQIKADFLGASVEAGPSVSFNRTYRTQAVVMAEGLAPVVNTDRTFDRGRRDRFGTPTPGKRTITIGCEVSLLFSATYAGAGGFSVFGVGGSASVSKQYSNAVQVTSNRIMLPETIDGRPVDLGTLSQLCHRDFLKTQVSGAVDVAGSLNIMMRNVLAGVRITRGR